MVIRQQRSGAAFWRSKIGTGVPRFQLSGDQYRASDGGAEPARRGLDQHGVQAEARGTGEVGVDSPWRENQ